MPNEDKHPKDEEDEPMRRALRDTVTLEQVRAAALAAGARCTHDLPRGHTLARLVRWELPDGVPVTYVESHGVGARGVEGPLELPAVTCDELLQGLKSPDSAERLFCLRGLGFVGKDKEHRSQALLDALRAHVLESDPVIAETARVILAELKG